MTAPIPRVVCGCARCGWGGGGEWGYRTAVCPWALVRVGHTVSVALFATLLFAKVWDFDVIFGKTDAHDREREERVRERAGHLGSQCALKYGMILTHAPLTLALCVLCLAG